MSPDIETPEPIQADPKSVDDFLRRAWKMHVTGDLKGAETDFRQSTQIDPRNAEGYYGLGLSLKLQRQGQPAIDAFQKTIELIGAGALSEDSSRATMLRHLSQWHIETIQKGLIGEPEP